MNRRLKKLVKDEINSRILLAKYGIVRKNYSNKKIRKLADKAIRIHDRRYNDIVASALAIGAVKMFVIPMLMGIATNAAAGSLREKLIDPLLDKTLNAAKKLMNVTPETPVADALFDTVVAGVGTLIKLFRKEGNPVAGKLQFAFNKIKG